MTPSSSPLATYRERSPYLRRDFALYDDRVVVTGSNRRQSFETRIPLEILAPFESRVSYRRWPLLGLLLLSAVLLGFVGLFVGVFQLPPSAPRVLAAGGLALVTAGLALGYCPLFTAYRFLSLAGVVVLDVIEAGPDRQRCREFVNQVSAAAEAIRRGKSTSPSIASAPPRPL
jgi:hypothetical protein